MYPHITEERQLIINTVKEFVNNEVKPVALEIDRSHKYPLELFKRAAELGFIGAPFSEAEGGVGLDWTTFALVTEEIAKESPVLAVVLGVHVALAGGVLRLLANEEQKAKYLLPAVRGEKILSYVSSEAIGAFDYAEFTTTAVLDGDEWVINGGKVFITNIDVADIYLVSAVTAGAVDPLKGHGLSFFIVEKGTPGLEFGKIENKVGWHGSNTGSVYLRNVRIPKENLLGNQDWALPAIHAAGADEWMTCGPLALGIAEAAYEKALAYSRERVQNGKSLYDQHQVVRHNLTEMFGDIEVLRSLVYMTTAMRDTGERPILHMGLCKSKGAAIAESVCSQAIQLLGGNGVVVETGLERYWRDAKLIGIAGGAIGKVTDSINRFI